MGVLSEGLIKYLTGEYDVELVRRLAVDNQGIKSLETLKLCVNLVELSLVGNEITDLTPLEGLDSLARVNLSSNRLSSLAGVEGLVNLEYLDLRENDISDLNELSKLAGCSKLTTLFLRDYESSKSNPACQHPAYFNKVTRLLPQLEVLDGESLRIREMAEDKLSSFLSALLPDEEARKTPPLEPWFEGMLEEEERDRRSPERRKVSHHHRRNNSLEEQMGVLEDTQDVRESIRGIRQLQESVDEVLRDTQGLLDMINLENGD